MASGASMLQIGLLGDFRLTSGAVSIASLTSPRLQSLVAYLLLHRAAPQPRAKLAFLLWPESSEAQALTNLRSLVLRLRENLPYADTFVHVDRTTLQWRAEAPWTLDVAQFEAAVARVSTMPHAGLIGDARAALDEAVALYRGDLLPTCYDDWIMPERERLRNLFAAAVEQLVALHEQARAYPEAIGAAQRLLTHDPLREESYRTLMRLYSLIDDPAAAAQVYRRCIETLERELGVAPSATTRALNEQLARTGDVDVAAQLTRRPPATLLGRGEEWARMLSAWRAARDRPRLVLIAGEAGIGKTRLAEELLAWAERQGFAVAIAHCYAAEGDIAYAPVTTWLRAPPLRAALAHLPAVWRTEIVRLLPELLVTQPDIPEPGPLSEGWQRARFHEALTHALLDGRRTLLLLLDDVQWCDRETLTWLHFVLRREPAPQLLVVATLRVEALPPDHPLDELRTALAREGRLDELTLAPLGSAETAALAAQVAGRALLPALLAAIYAEAEGNPLFVVETVRAWRAAHDSGGHPTLRPLRSPTLQAVIHERLSRLSPAMRDLASLAAAIGRQFSLDLLSRASETGLETLADGLDELCRQRIVREHGPDAYDFSHDQLRAVIYTDLSNVRRKLLHGRVAQALEARAARDEAAAQIAEHFTRAGMPEQALPHYVRAAQAAGRIYANHQAAELYARAVDIAMQLDRPGPELTALYAARGRALELEGRYEEAVQVYRDLEALARVRGDTAMECAAVAQLVMPHLVNTSGVQNLALAEPLITRGLALARAIGDPDQEARLLWGKLFLSNLLGRIAEAYEAGEASIALARRHGLREPLAFALHDFANSLRWNGDVTRGNAYAEEARVLFRELGNLPLLGDNLCQQAGSDFFQLNFESALQHANEAIAISQEIGAISNLGFAMGVRAELQLVRGEWGQAQADARESLRWTREYGTHLWPVLLAQIGGLQRMIGQTDHARALHLEMRAASEQGSPFLVQLAEAHLALDAFAAGDPQAGAEWLRLAKTREGHPIMTAMSLGLLASAAVCRAEGDGDWEEALQAVERDLSFARQRQRLVHQPDLLYHQGRCFVGLGLVAEAQASFRQALVLAEPAKLRPVMWKIRAALAQLSRTQGRAAEAEAERQAAAALALEIAGFLDDPTQRTSFLATPAVRALITP